MVGGGAGFGLGTGDRVVVAGGEYVGGSGAFSSSKIGEGDDGFVASGIHCFAIFFSTSTTLRDMSKTIKPNAM